MKRIFEIAMKITSALAPNYMLVCISDEDDAQHHYQMSEEIVVSEDTERREYSINYAIESCTDDLNDTVSNRLSTLFGPCVDATDRYQIWKCENVEIMLLCVNNVEIELLLTKSY